MDLSLSPSELEFREEVRAWIEANHPGPEPESDEADAPCCEEKPEE